MKFFKASAWRNFHSIQLLGSSNQKVFLSRSFGNLGIGISASASPLASTLQKKIIFVIRFFFKKKDWIFVFFLVLSYGMSTTLLQILCSLQFPIHPVKGFHWYSRKKLFEHSEASVLVFWKKNCSENFCILCILSSETSWVEFFLSTLVGLAGITPKSSLEQLFCRQGFIRAI